MMQSYRQLLALCCYSWLVSSVVGSSDSSSLPSLSTLTSSLPKHLFPKQVVQDAVDKEIRKMIFDRSAKANATKAERALQEAEEEDDLFKPSPTTRSLRALTEASGGEWDEVNAILNSLQINIPAINISIPDLLGLTISANVSGYCNGIAVSDILLDWDKSISPRDEVTLAYKIQVLGAKLKCYVEIDWDTGVLDVSDSIKMKIVLNDNSFGIAIQVEGAPPQNSTFLGCKVKVNIGDVASSGGFSSNIINDLNYLLVNLVQDEAALISGTICELLFGFTETIDDLFGSLAALLDPFISEYVPVDALALENSLPAEPELVSFQDTEGLGNIVNVLLTNLEGLFSAQQINTLITGLLLDGDPNGVFVLELGTAPSMAPTTEAEAHPDRALQLEGLISDDLLDPVGACIPDLGDLLPVRRRLGEAIGSEIGEQFTEHLKEQTRRLQLDIFGDILSNITLDDIVNTTDLLVINEFVPLTVSVAGLNNFTDAAPLQVIGEHTLLTQLSLSYIWVEVELYVDLELNGIPIQQTISAAAELRGLFVNTSYVIGLSQAEVDQWTIGTFLNTSNAVGCIVAAVETFGVSKLEVTVDFIGTPAVEGVFSDAVNDLANTGVEAIFCTYQDLILGAIPGFFQNNLTLIINDFAACFLEVSNATCVQSSLEDILGIDPGDTEGDVDFDFKRSISKKAQSKQGTRVPGFLDFRDLLLPPDEARELGGSGRQPYGDLVSLAYSTLMGSMTGADDTGMPGINGLLPSDGLQLDMELIDFELDFSEIDIISSLLKSASIYAHNLRVQNLNTIMAPLEVLAPTRSAHVLSNILNFGSVSTRSLNVSANVLTGLYGNNSGLAMENEMDGGVSFSEMDLLADFRVMISTMDFINFPIADLLELPCWAALVQTPDEMVDGEMMDHGFKITRMLLDIVKMSVGLRCLNCTSELLPGAIRILEDVGATVVLGNRVGPLLEELATSDMIAPLIADLIPIGNRAGRLCPHSPLFNTTPNATELDLESFDLVIPPLTNEGIDSVVFAGILGAGVFAVVFSETHLDNNVGLSDPLSGQESLNVMEEINLLDWYRLNETFIPLAGDMLDLVKGFLGPTEDGGIGINGFFGDSFNLTLDMQLDLIDGYEIVIDGASVSGLESFKQFDILEPIASQTLKNTIAMENLTVALEFSLNVTNNTEPAIPYRATFDLTDVNATFYLFTAVDMDKIEALEIGQLLFIENILPCFLAASVDVHVPAMRVSIGSMSRPVVEGLLPDTSAAAEASLEGIFAKYSDVMIEATNYIFDNTIRGLVNDFVEGFITNTSACKTPTGIFGNEDGPSAELIDFRDLLLAPEEALLVGGSGLQPYGNVVSAVYSLMIGFLVGNATGPGELLEVNSLIDQFSESPSGEPGLLRLEDELFALALNFSQWVEQRVQVAAFDARIRNLNTLVSPIAIASPTTHPYVLENMINFGPIAGKPLNATIGALLELEGDLSSLDMFNMFDIGGELSEIDVVAAVTLHVLRDNLMGFPLRDLFEFNCWLSLFQNPNATEFDAGASGFRFEKVLAKLASLSVRANCLNCTSNVLDDVINLVDRVGASEVFGDRLGFLIEDIASSDAIPVILKDFIAMGDEAGRLCPHHPLYNTTSYELEDTNSSLTIPALSAVSVDTLLFAGVIFAEIAVVIGADAHLQNPSEAPDALYFEEKLEVPEGANLIDWQNLESVGIPFMAEIFDLVRGFVGDPSSINELAAGFMNANGTFVLPLDFSFEMAGVELTVKSVEALGLDNFTEFDILDPVGPQTMLNTFAMERLSITLDVSIDILESTDAPNNLKVTMEMEGINGTVPVYAAFDQDKLGALKIGSLLFLENILPCLLSTTYGVQLEQMLISVDSISEPVFGGFFLDTGESVEASTTAIFEEYGDMIRNSIPLVFQDTVRVFINSFLASFGESDCKTYPTNSDLHYIDFRQMFQPSNSTAYSPYGDIIPFAKELLEQELLSENPETQMPKINDVLIAPFTEDQSGVEGTLLLPGKIFGFDTGALEDFGVGNIGVELFDARVENLDTVGEPLHVAEPNKTRADLLDNGATFGTQFSPLRFAIRGTLSFLSPFVVTRDEMDIFGELRSAPIFSVLLARIGSEEFLNFPLGYTSDVNCWLGTMAAPALKALQAGDLKANPILAIHYLNIAFQSMRVSASCYNCTTGGLEVVPDLLEILETTTAKNVLGHRNVELIVGLINSDFAQVWMLRFFQASIAQCGFMENSTLTELIVPNAEFPQLTDYEMETGVFTVTAFIQLGLVVLAETIADLKDIEPIIADPVPDIPEGTRLVDFTALDEFPTGQLALSMIGFLNDYLGTENVDEETGEVSLAINSILGNPIMPFEEFVFDNEFDIGISNLKIRMLGAVVSGLDTFTRFAVADITGPTSMRHEVGWDRLQVEIQLEIDLTGEPEFIFMRDRELQDEEDDGKFQFKLTIELAEMMAIADTFIAMDYELLKYVELGSFLRFDYILPCIQATILHLELTDMHLEIGRVTKMEVSGFKSPDVQTAAENLEETILEKYGDVIASMAPNVFSGALRPIMNGLINGYLRDSDVECEKFPFDPSTDGFIDFRDLILSPEDSVELGGSGNAQYGDIISTVFGYSQLFIRFFLLPNFENIALEGSLFDQGIRFDVRQFKSVFVLKVSDVELENVNSIGTLAYTEPVQDEPFLLDNEVKLGVGRAPLGIKFRVFIAFKGLGSELSEVDISNDFSISLDISSLNVVLQTLMRVREEEFVRFPLRNMLDLNCWLALIPPPELDDQGFRVPGAQSNLVLKELAVTLKELNMAVECHNCTSPALVELSDKLQSPGVADVLTEDANILIADLINMLGGDFLQDQIDAILDDAPRQCEHTNDKVDPNAPPFQFVPPLLVSTDDNGYITYMIAIVIPLVLAVILILGVRTIVNRRHKKWLAGLPSERVFLVQQKQEKEEHRETEINELTYSMYESPEIPTLARYLVPIIVVVNIGFFLSGHLSLGGRAMIDISIAGESFRVDNFYDFSIAQSTLDMWHAGGEELATLILLFSGIWPYTKQLITLALWFLPPSVVSVSRRGQFLLWLDILAKWSMIDIFVLLITIAGFRLGGVSPIFPWLPPKMWEVQLIVVPMWGLYANMIAQLMSQISSHFIVMYHRRILKHGKQMYRERHHPTAKHDVPMEQQDVTELLSPDVPEEEKKDVLCKHPFIRPHKTEGARLVPRRVVNGLLPICCTLLGVLIVFCCYWPSLRLEAYGAVGLLIEAGNKFQAQAVREESIFSKAKILIDQARYLDEIKHYIGNGFLAILLIGTLLVVPLMSLGTLLCMWIVPSTRKRRGKVAVLLEILQAWQYVEVYMLGIIIESWQLGSISKLFINRYCESINPTLELVASYDIIDGRDAQCFELGASIAQGAYALIPFVIGLALVGTYIVKAYIQTLREQHDEEEDVTEEEKLRAFDRTTWDNRDGALENIKNPPVLFTDTFRWTLTRKEGTGDDGSLELTVADEADADKPLTTPTYPVADTSDSDEADKSVVNVPMDVPMVEQSVVDDSAEEANSSSKDAEA